MSLRGRIQILIIIAICVALSLKPIASNIDRPDFALAQDSNAGEIAIIQAGGFGIINTESIRNKPPAMAGGNSEPEWSLIEKPVVHVNKFSDNSELLDWPPQPAGQGDPTCGTWRWDGPHEEKDLRIKTSLITKGSKERCRGAFRLKNETGIWGFGGYSLELKEFSKDTEVTWMPEPRNASAGVILTPLLDAELHAVPIKPDVEGNIVIRGEMTLYTVAVDISLFLLKIAFELAPPGTTCVIPEEIIFATAVREANILTSAAELALQGKFSESWEEISQVNNHFYERSGEVMVEIGYDCAADLLKSIAEKPVVIGKISVAYLTWVPLVIYDYFIYNGRSANVNLVYTPIETTQPTEIMVFQPSGVTGEQISGSCWTLSIASPREGAWRCMADSRIYDPCFSPEGENDYVICGALPLGDTRGFKLNLTENLPVITSPSQLRAALALELEDGTTCRFLTTGTLFEVEGNYFNYGCSDGSVLLEVKSSEVWTATKARLSSDWSAILETVEVNIKIVWI